MVRDPFDLTTHPLMLSISTLTVRRSRAGTTFLLLRRNPETEPVAPSGAACLHLAWQHHAAVLGYAIACQVLPNSAVQEQDPTRRLSPHR
jgi:hypothetical protein